jgi:hypothetical protein
MLTGHGVNPEGSTMSSFDVSNFAVGSNTGASAAPEAPPTETKKPVRKKTPAPAVRSEGAKPEGEPSIDSEARRVLESLADGSVNADTLRPSEWKALIDGGVIKRRHDFEVRRAVACFVGERDVRRELAELPSVEEAAAALAAARDAEAAVAVEVEELELLDLAAFAGAAGSLKSRLTAASEARREAQQVVNRIASLRELLKSWAPEAIKNEVRRRSQEEQSTGPRGRLLSLREKHHAISVAIDANNPASPLYDTDAKFRNSLLSGFIESHGWGDLVTVSSERQRSRSLATKEFRARVVKLGELLPAIAAEIAELEPAVAAAEAYTQEPLEAWIDSGFVPQEYV